MIETASFFRPRVGIVVSHPIQYYSPVFRELARRFDLHVFYGQVANDQQQAAAGFGVGFAWDIDLMSGYASSVLDNKAAVPDVNAFAGCDVPTIKDEIAAKDLDAILVVGWYQKVFLQAIWAGRRLGIPLIVRGDSHLGMSGNLMKKAVKEIMYPFFLRAFDAALYVGSHSRTYYTHFKYPEERLFFSPHCVDTSRFQEQATSLARRNRRAALGVPDETPLVLFAGKLVAFKRPLDFVAGVSRLRQQGIPAEAMIAGSGPLEDEVKAAAKSANVPLHYLGFCNQSVMPSVYAAADVLVLPSTGRETWGLVANEALASGTPIVVSHEVGCAPDLAADSHVGRQFSGGDFEAMAEALAETLSTPPSPADILAVSERYSIERAADGIEQAVQFAVDARRGVSVQ